MWQGRTAVRPCAGNVEVRRDEDCPYAKAVPKAAFVYPRVMIARSLK